MKYRNKKTQAVIETACIISGGDWELVEDQPKTNTRPAPKKTARKKSGE